MIVEFVRVFSFSIGMWIQSKVAVEERAIFKGVLKKYGGGADLLNEACVKTATLLCRGYCLSVVKIYDINGVEY